MLTLYYRTCADLVDRIPFAKIKSLAHKHGGQYFSGTFRTCGVPGLSTGFIFRRKEDAESFEQAITTYSPTLESRQR